MLPVSDVRGGKRKGAGRPALPDNIKKKAISPKLPPALIAWMDKQDASRNVLIENAMVAQYDLCPHCYKPLHKFHNCELNPTP